ncbi:glycosyltransferase [Solidesulfovibrio sp.]
MKILMLCTHPTGGAAIAARRQMQALNHLGHDCKLASIVEDFASKTISVLSQGDDVLLSVPAHDFNYVGRFTYDLCTNNRTDISNTWFSFWPCAGVQDEKLLEICLDFDVIHFHWVTQLVTSRFLRRLKSYNRRLVFTGHDMHFFTGGCHYSAGCTRYRTDCHPCLQLRTDPVHFVENSFQQKISALQNLRATWLFPSHWLADCFRQSALHDDHTSVKVLHNCIDTDRFHCLPEDQRCQLRRTLGFPDDEIVFVAGASDNREQRKGFIHIARALDRLVDALRHPPLGPACRCSIITFGLGKPDFGFESPQLRHVHLGPVDEERIIALFQTADALLFPSEEENFSNTILESLLCGCPVAAFAIGGVPDIVTHAVNGLLADRISSLEFGSLVARLAEPGASQTLRQSTRDWREEHASRYGYAHIGAELSRVYADAEAVTHPRTFRSPFPLGASETFYADMMGRLCRDVSPEGSKTSDIIARAIRIINGEDPPQPESSLTIPSLYSGFGFEEYHKDLGRLAWMLDEAHVYFKATEGMRPALCIQVQQFSWVNDILDRAMSDFSATINGHAVPVHTVSRGTEGYYTYLWLVMEPNMLVAGQYNSLDLFCGTLAYDNTNDPRRLSFLHYQAALIDLVAVQHCLGQFVLDYATSAALSLKASQTQYLCNQWKKDENVQASLPNTIQVLLDFLNVKPEAAS